MPKLTYSNVGIQKFSRGEIPGTPTPLGAAYNAAGKGASNAARWGERERTHRRGSKGKERKGRGRAAPNTLEQGRQKPSDGPGPKQVIWCCFVSRLKLNCANMVHDWSVAFRLTWILWYVTHWRHSYLSLDNRRSLLIIINFIVLLTLQHNNWLKYLSITDWTANPS